MSCSFLGILLCSGYVIMSCIWDSSTLTVYQIAVSTIKYLVELRGWNGIALPAVHSRDAKIYIDDPGPWIMGLATEARYSIRPAPEVCVCDLYVDLCMVVRFSSTYIDCSQGHQLFVGSTSSAHDYFTDSLRRSCPAPPVGIVSSKQQRDKYRQRLLAAFESHYHPDHSVPRQVAYMLPNRSPTNLAL